MPLFRHGQRTPAHTFPNDSYISSIKFTVEPFGWGQLSNVRSYTHLLFHFLWCGMRKAFVRLPRQLSEHVNAMILITYYYNVFRKDITKKCIIGRQYEYSGKNLRGWTADGTGVFVCTMDDFDVSRDTTDISLTWQTEDHSTFPKCHFVEVVLPRLGNVRTARKRLKKTYIYFFWCKIRTVYYLLKRLYSSIYEFHYSTSNI